MNVKYIVDFAEGGDTYGLAKILKGDSVEIYYNMSAETNTSFPEILSIFAAKDAGNIVSLKIRPYEPQELAHKQEFLAFVVARASARQNVTVISKTFKMPFQVDGVRVISTMEKLYKGTDPYFFSYVGHSTSIAPIEQPEPKAEVKPKPEPKTKVLTIKRDRQAIPDSKLPDEIRKCIKKNEITQVIFAELCGTSQSTLSKFLHGSAEVSEATRNAFRKTLIELDEMVPTAQVR